MGFWSGLYHKAGEESIGRVRGKKKRLKSHGNKSNASTTAIAGQQGAWPGGDNLQLYLPGLMDK